ncbi:hypothetical protein P775_08775 [Puniceibacterium antarcticum]|uniref:NADH dehydrogenase subunit E n=1 Tax=Puniceibacterium antarcticum TaxID=1206336 RepID=A0A2G8RGD7_9RHOB|nr:hypothetical protein [Puniceibacterium antarcticum]PIL20610.1 hypothetical protein P775_08775 [Puniceibacterium antarcticum]
MNRFLGASAIFALLSACAMPPEGVDDASLAMFDAAVASIGCDMSSEEDYIPVELQTGLNRQQVLDIAAYKIETKDGVALSNGGFRLKTGACADTGLV